MSHIVEDNIQKFNKYIETPPHPSYISGFIDGDGSVSIMKIKGGYNPRVSIAQSRTNIIKILLLNAPEQDFIIDNNNSPNYLFYSSKNK